MKLKTILLTIILSTIFITSASAQMQYEDFSISHKSVGSSCMSTIDLRITQEIGTQQDHLVEYDYGNIRKDGVLMSVYYSNILAKAQWNDFPSPHGITLMPTNIYLPIDRWLDSGVVADGTWWIRIVILNPVSCTT